MPFLAASPSALHVPCRSTAAHLVGSIAFNRETVSCMLQRRLAEANHLHKSLVFVRKGRRRSTKLIRAGAHEGNGRPSNGSAAPSSSRKLKPQPGVSVVAAPGERSTQQVSKAANQVPKQEGSRENGSASTVQTRADKYVERTASEQITDAPSCPMPNFATTATRVTLLQPVPLLPSSAQKPSVNKRPLLIYVPGMDGTGQGIRPQIAGLYTDGYDIRCVYIPSNDRSTWNELVECLLPLIEQAASLSNSGPPAMPPASSFLKYQQVGAKVRSTDEAKAAPTRHVTLLAESFGTCLALRVAARAPKLISRLVLVNPATNFDINNRLVSFAAATGLLAAFPGPLYSFAQDVMLPLLVKRNRVSADANKDLLSPIDYVPAACAAWRLQMLNEGTLSREEQAALVQPTMLVAGAKDRVLPSMTEAARLQSQLPNAWRVVLPESGHTALLEDNIDISAIMRKNGFTPPRPSIGEETSQRVHASPADVSKSHRGAESVSKHSVERPRSTGAPSPGFVAAAGDLDVASTNLSTSPDDSRVVSINPGVGEAVNSQNPRVREAVSSTNSGFRASDRAERSDDASTRSASSGNGASTQSANDVVSRVLYEDFVPKRRRAAVPDEVYDEMGQILEPWRILTSPLVSGAGNLPDPNQEPRRPILFVGNHTVFGLYDSPLLVHELFMRGFRCRGLAHPGHWLSGAGSLFERYGNVKATPFAAYKLLKEGEDVLLFPGGAREVVKQKGEEYQLLWKEKADFVRMASKLGAIIVPFGALGGDDAYKILWDRSDIQSSPFGPAVAKLYEMVGLESDVVYPVTRLPIPGIPIPSPIPIPAIERIYFHFAPVVDTRSYACDLTDPEACMSLYSLVRRSVEDSILHCKEVRARDPERMLPARLLAKASRLLPEFSPRE